MPHEYNCEQGSDEWVNLRCGRPTSSQFKQIITPAKMEYPKKGTDTYKAELLAELLLGRPVYKKTSEWMDRGKIMEAEALTINVP